jgi:hypothetical protein
MRRGSHYLEWLRVLRGIPKLHVLRVKNESNIVNGYLNRLRGRGLVESREFRCRQLPGENGCVIFHHSLDKFGELVRSKTLNGRRYHDWEQIFSAVPRGFGCELSANYKSVSSAVRQFELRRKFQHGEYRVIRRRSKKGTQVILFHEPRPPLNHRNTAA